jgi:hydrogenase maturation protease
MTPRATPEAEPLVVGLGSPDRGDDAVGPTVARAVETLGLPGMRVAVHEDPTALIHLWSDFEFVVVVDAVMSGVKPGTIIVREVGADSPALNESTWAETGRGGTHAFGLATAIELARTLGRLPRRVILVGVEAESFDHGEGLTSAVAAAVEPAVEAVRGALATSLECACVGGD